MRGVIIDIDHQKRGEETVVRMFVRTEDGHFLVEETYYPYIYVVGDDLRAIEDSIGKEDGVVSVERVKRFIKWERREVLLVRIKHHKYAQNLRKKVEEWGGECREYDIPVERKYMYERGLRPVSAVDFRVDGGGRARCCPANGEIPLRTAAFDLEVCVEGRVPDPKRDEIIMASYVDSDGSKVVITTKDIALPFVKKVEDEAQIISELNRIIKEGDPDVIFTYNGDGFDLPYLKERARFANIKLEWGRDNSEPRIHRVKGGKTTTTIAGRAHIDVFHIVQFMAAVGAINTFKLDLETVYKAVLGKEKIKIEHKDIAKEWKVGDLKKLAKYCLQDSEACYELGMDFLPLYAELARITATNLHSVARMSNSKIVEWKLILEAWMSGKLVPRKPKEREVRKRIAESYEGAFVREPIPGLHENIVVFDFRSLYPTIIVSHNVDPDTVNAPCKGEVFTSPAGHYFCKEPRGLLPRVIEDILEERFQLKDLLKKMDRGSTDYKITYAKQQALKIIANSAYGYLGFARARWYSRECAEAITAWARKYIKDVMKKAEEAGLKVIYGDTDSVFVKLPRGEDLSKAFEFLNNVNKELPKPMSLEFDGYYVRGIFLTKRGGRRAAKKKYALIDEKGNLKITGMEYVRRDWADIAKDVQKKVLEFVLGEGKEKEAIKYVKNVVDEIRKGKIPKEKLIIYTQIQKKLDSYESRGPHVAVAQRAVKRGVKIEPGTIIGYIVTKDGKSISEKAELASFVEEGNYDPEYYINNQVLPAVMPILEELGYKEEDLRKGGAQRTLFEFT